MKKETFFQRIIKNILKKLGFIEEQEIDKADMCRKAVESGVCPHACEICEWNSMR